MCARGIIIVEYIGEWEYREVQQDEATQLPVERVGTKHSRKDMFRAELRLIEYPGKLPSYLFVSCQFVYYVVV